MEGYIDQGFSAVIPKPFTMDHVRVLLSVFARRQRVAAM
jgi:hypothetical protein